MTWSIESPRDLQYVAFSIQPCALQVGDFAATHFSADSEAQILLSSRAYGSSQNRMAYLDLVCSIVRPYYICTIWDNGKFNVFRDSGYPRGFITWDDSIGIHPQNPRCYCEFPSRQDRKGEKARVKTFGEGFWVCASGACDYFSDRKDGAPYEDGRKLLDDSDGFHPHLLKGFSPYC